MKILAISMLLLLSTFTKAQDGIHYVLKLNKKDYSSQEEADYKYITKANYQNIEINAVKYLSFNGRKKRKLTKLIRHFTQIETLNLSTEWTGVHVRWAGGLGEWIGHYKKSKLKRLPNWLPELSRLHTLKLTGHVGLNFEQTINLLTQLSTLKSLTIEIKSRDIQQLNLLTKLTQLRELTIYKENISPKEENQINKVLSKNKKIKFTIETFKRTKR